MTREYPDYPMVGVGVVVWKDETVLLIQRGKAAARGAWSLPAGDRNSARRRAKPACARSWRKPASKSKSRI